MQGTQKESDKVGWGLRFVLLSALLLFLLVTVTEHTRSPGTQPILPPPSDSIPEDLLIIPGTRAGPILLGSSTTTFQNILGPGQLRPEAEGLIHLYPEQGLVIYSEDQKVMAITLRSENFATRSGVKIGSDVDAVLRQMGENYEIDGDPNSRSYVLRDWEAGWHVGISADSVDFIHLTPRVHLPSF